MGKKKKKLPVRSMIVATIVMGLAGYFISVCLTSIDQEYIEKDWKPAPGVILNPQISLQGKNNKERTDQGDSQRINYSYTINDLDYESNVVSKNTFVDRSYYPEGKKITVYYNPNSHHDSVLVRTKVQKQYLYAVMVFCLVVIAVVIFGLIGDFKRK